jgi:hypothetical protein
MFNGADPMPLEPEPEDGEADQDETMVARAGRPGGSPLRAPPTFPQPVPAAGRSNGPPMRQTTTQPPQRFPQTAAMSAQPPQQAPYAMPATTGEVAFSETIGMNAPQGMPMHDPNDYRQQSMPPQNTPFGHGPHGQSGDFMHLGPQGAPSNRIPPTMPRGGHWDNRTGTAMAYNKRRPPMWVVAALSCSIALLIAGVAIALMSSSGGSAPTKPAGSAGTPAVALATPGTGPFSTTKLELDKVTTAGPGSSAVPVAPTAAPTAPPPAMTAAAPEPATPPAVAPPAPAPITPAAPTVAAAVPPPAPAPIAPAATPVRPAAAPQPVPQPAAAPTTPKKPSALGAITVVCMPKCDQIIDNGTPLGPGHIFNRPVPSGKHTLGLSAPNGVKKNLVVEVVPEQTREVRISMDH